MSKGKQNRLSAGPEYRFSGQYLKVSFVLAWIVILAIVAGGLFGSEKADKLADIVVPSMVALVVALLGVHRAFGSLDYRARGQDTGEILGSEGKNEQNF